MHTSLRGRTVMVTGGASGIGAAIVREMAARGATLVVADRDALAAQEIAAAVGGSAWAVDLSVTEALDDPTLAERLTGVDILVNNAGIQHVSPIHEFDRVAFHRILALMVEAPFLLVRAALPGMYERGFGRIINISSVHGLRASPFKSAYVAAKHGIEGLSKVIALEGAEHGVTSNCVSPGYVRTALVDSQISQQAAAHGLPEHEVLARIILERSAIKRLIEPGEVATLASWLASDEAGMVTGTSYTIDGGWSAM